MYVRCKTTNVLLDGRYCGDLFLLEFTLLNARYACHRLHLIYALGFRLSYFPLLN